MKEKEFADIAAKITSHLIEKYNNRSKQYDKLEDVIKAWNEY